MEFDCRRKFVSRWNLAFAAPQWSFFAPPIAALVLALLIDQAPRGRLATFIGRQLFVALRDDLRKGFTPHVFRRPARRLPTVFAKFDLRQSADCTATCEQDYGELRTLV